MSDSSDDEELKILREAALLSKKKQQRMKLSAKLNLKEVKIDDAVNAGDGVIRHRELGSSSRRTPPPHPTISNFTNQHQVLTFDNKWNSLPPTNLNIAQQVLTLPPQQQQTFQQMYSVPSTNLPQQQHLQQQQQIQQHLLPQQNLLPLQRSTLPLQLHQQVLHYQPQVVLRMPATILPPQQPQIFLPPSQQQLLPPSSVQAHFQQQQPPQIFHQHQQQHLLRPGNLLMRHSTTFRPLVTQQVKTAQGKHRPHLNPHNKQHLNIPQASFSNINNSSSRSNLIVIQTDTSGTDAESKLSDKFHVAGSSSAPNFNKSSLRNVPSTAATSTATFIRPQDKWNNDGSKVVEKGKSSKFKRYDEDDDDDDDDDDEDNNDSDSDDARSKSADADDSCKEEDIYHHGVSSTIGDDDDITIHNNVTTNNTTTITTSNSTTSVTFATTNVVNNSNDNNNKNDDGDGDDTKDSKDDNDINEMDNNNKDIDNDKSMDKDILNNNDHKNDDVNKDKNDDEGIVNMMKNNDGDCSTSDDDAHIKNINGDNYDGDINNKMIKRLSLKSPALYDADSDYKVDMDVVNNDNDVVDTCKNNGDDESIDDNKRDKDDDDIDDDKLIDIIHSRYQSSDNDENDDIANNNIKNETDTSSLSSPPAKKYRKRRQFSFLDDDDDIDDNDFQLDIPYVSFHLGDEGNDDAMRTCQSDNNDNDKKCQGDDDDDGEIQDDSDNDEDKSSRNDTGIDQTIKNDVVQHRSDDGDDKDEKPSSDDDDDYKSDANGKSSTTIGTSTSDQGSTRNDDDDDDDDDDEMSDHTSSSGTHNNDDDDQDDKHRRDGKNDEPQKYNKADNNSINDGDNNDDDYDDNSDNDVKDEWAKKVPNKPLKSYSKDANDEHPSRRDVRNKRDSETRERIHYHDNRRYDNDHAKGKVMDYIYTNRNVNRHEGRSGDRTDKCGFNDDDFERHLDRKTSGGDDYDVLYYGDRYHHHHHHQRPSDDTYNIKKRDEHRYYDDEQKRYFDEKCNRYDNYDRDKHKRSSGRRHEVEDGNKNNISGRGSREYLDDYHYSSHRKCDRIDFPDSPPINCRSRHSSPPCYPHLPPPPLHHDHYRHEHHHHQHHDHHQRHYHTPPIIRQRLSSPDYHDSKEYHKNNYDNLNDVNDRYRDDYRQCHFVENNSNSRDNLRKDLYNNDDEYRLRKGKPDNRETANYSKEPANLLSLSFSDKHFSSRDQSPRQSTEMEVENRKDRLKSAKSAIPLRLSNTSNFMKKSASGSDVMNAEYRNELRPKSQIGNADDVIKNRNYKTSGNNNNNNNNNLGNNNNKNNNCSKKVRVDSNKSESKSTVHAILTSESTNTTINNSGKDDRMNDDDINNDDNNIKHQIKSIKTKESLEVTKKDSTQMRKLKSSLNSKFIKDDFKSSPYSNESNPRRKVIQSNDSKFKRYEKVQRIDYDSKNKPTACLSDTNSGLEIPDIVVSNSRRDKPSRVVVETKETDVNRAGTNDSLLVVKKVNRTDDAERVSIHSRLGSKHMQHQQYKQQNSVGARITYPDLRQKIGKKRKYDFP